MSKKDSKWYTGATQNLNMRLLEHNQNKVSSTKSRGPFELIYYEACTNEHDAFVREKYLKSGISKRYLKNRIKNFLSLIGVHPIRSRSLEVTAASNGGFIALMASIIVSLILVGFVFTLSTSGFYARGSVLGDELKRVSLGLAESCENTALLQVAQNYNYSVSAPIIIPVGAESCTIKSVSSTVSGNTKTFTINTRANYKGAYSNIQSQATAQDPTVAPSPPGAPASPACADTVMMLDRTGSIDATELSKEKTAATALVNLYKTIPNFNNWPPIAYGAFGISSVNPSAIILSHFSATPPASTAYYDPLLAAITGTATAGSYTSIQSAIDVSQAELASLADGKQKVLIIISDGDANRVSTLDPICNSTNDPSIAAQCAADTSKLAYSHIFAIHYGDVGGRNFLAKLASGTVSYPSHQPGSANEAGTSTSLPVIDTENNDGDYFYISPTADQLAGLFTQIGAIVCPAVGGGGPATLPPSSIVPNSWQELPN